MNDKNYDDSVDYKESQYTEKFYIAFNELDDELEKIKNGLTNHFQDWNEAYDAITLEMAKVGIQLKYPEQTDVNFLRRDAMQSAVLLFRLITELL